MAAPRISGLSRARTARRAPDLRTESVREVVHEGRARVGKRTKLLVKRLKPGDIAVIDHEDIDRVAADDLVAKGVRCVLNASPSSSGRYPNPGPMILADAGHRPSRQQSSDLCENQWRPRFGGNFRRGEDRRYDDVCECPPDRARQLA